MRGEVAWVDRAAGGAARLASLRNGHESLPPGSLRLPFIGESLAILRNPFGFLEERQRRHGNVFKSRVLGRRVAFFSGVEGAKAFYDEHKISRADAHPSPVVKLFGGINMEMYDGSKHRALKSIALTAFDQTAIAGYVPAMQTLVAERLSEFARETEFSATAALRKLAIEAICLNIMGLTPGTRTDAIHRGTASLARSTGARAGSAQLAPSLPPAPASVHALSSPSTLRSDAAPSSHPGSGRRIVLVGPASFKKLVRDATWAGGPAMAGPWQLS